MSLWDTLAAPILKIIDKVIPDRAAAQAVKDQLSVLAAQGALNEEMAQLTAVTSAQSDINKIEAASPSTFVSGWRPFVGWVCASGFACVYIVFPLLTWLTTLFGKSTAFPTLDSGSLMTLLLGMLGMGGMRMAEKMKGVAAK